jgi:hypothetical protein
MSSTPASAKSAAIEATWRDVELQLDELLQLARATTPAKEFHAALLQRVAQAVSAGTTLLWMRLASNSLPAESPPAAAGWELQAAWGNRGRELSFGSGTALADHLARLPRRLEDSQTEPLELSNVQLPGPGWSTVVPVRVDGETVAVLEVFWQMAVPLAMHRNIRNILTAFTEAAAEYHRGGQLRDLRSRLDDSLGLDRFSLVLQRLLDPRAIWFTIANEVGQYIECDRVCVLSNAGGWRVQAVSHLEAVDRRSPVVGSAERLASAAVDAQPIWLQQTSRADSLPAATRWHEYLEESPTRSAALVPLVSAGTDVVGALLLERFAERPFTGAERWRVERLARHAAAAVARGSQLQSHRWLAKLRSQSTLLVLLIGIAVVAVGFVPVDFEISARGRLQPVSRHDLFAPADGLVRTLHVTDAQEVATGAVLVELTNEDLEFELTRVSGELQTARQQLATVQAARLESASSARESRGQLAADEERLKQVIQGWEQQYQHFLRQRDELTVRSPIAGRIVTSNIDQVLRSRPLRRGQLLLTVADEKGGWILESHVADQDVGHVLAARQSGGELPIRFIVATQPTVTHRGQVTQIADWTELDESGQPTVKVTAIIEDPSGLAARPGATTTARIYCGRASLAYVWLRDVIELVRTRVLF